MTNKNNTVLEKSDLIAKELSKSNGQAHNALNQFFKDLNISKIYYIDDRCSIQELKEAFKGKLKALFHTKPAKLDFIDWSDPQPAFEKRIDTLWDGVDDEERRQMFLSILQYEDNNEELENSTAPLKLKELLKDKIELLSPADWVTEKDKIINDISQDSKALFLFDIEFKHAPLDDNRDGRDLAAELLSSEELKELVYCGLFSHIFSIEEETEKRNEYCNSHNIDKSKFYTISKKRFQNDSYLPSLAEGVKNALIINEVEFLKNESTEVLKESFKNALNEINNLSPDSFNHIIQKFSSDEGIWEMETLIRINNIITRDKALNTLLSETKRIKLNQSLLKIRDIDRVKTGSDTPYDKSQIQELRRKELYTNSVIINKLHFPLSNGDIFTISDKEYILLGQPCNIALRKKGNRNYTYDIGFLLEIETIPSDKINNLTMQKIESVDNNEGNVKVVKFYSFNAVSLLPLDLTVYNIDGAARINLRSPEIELETIQSLWKDRYKKVIYKVFNSYANNIKEYNAIDSTESQSLKDSVYYGEIFKGYNINNDNALSDDGNTITFEIKRISNYKEPYSSDLLQRFMNYLSRNAFEGDFYK